MKLSSSLLISCVKVGHLCSKCTEKAWEWGYEAGSPEIWLKNEYELSRYNCWASAAVKWVQRYSWGWWNPEVILVMFQESVTIDDDTTHSRRGDVTRQQVQCIPNKELYTEALHSQNYDWRLGIYGHAEAASWLRLILLFCLALNRYRKPSSRPSRLEASDTQK